MSWTPTALGSALYFGVLVAWRTFLDVELSAVAAFVAAGVALLVGVISPLIGRRTAREAMREQRRLANEDRLWHQRAATYEELLRWAGPMRSVGTSPDELGNPEGIRRTAEELRMPLELEARMTAYASGAVYGSAKAFREASKEFLNATADWLEYAKSSSQEENVQFKQRCEATAEAADVHADRMAQLVSDDLHGVLPDDAGRMMLRLPF